MDQKDSISIAEWHDARTLLAWWSSSSGRTSPATDSTCTLRRLDRVRFEKLSIVWYGLVAYVQEMVLHKKHSAGIITRSAMVTKWIIVTSPGQYIGKIDGGSPAEAAGLQEGDRIVEVALIFWSTCISIIWLTDISTHFGSWQHWKDWLTRTQLNLTNYSFIVLSEFLKFSSKLKISFHCWGFKTSR